VLCIVTSPPSSLINKTLKFVPPRSNAKKFPTSTTAQISSLVRPTHHVGFGIDHQYMLEIAQGYNITQLIPSSTI